MGEEGGKVRFRPTWRQAAARLFVSIALLVWFGVLGVGWRFLLLYAGAILAAVLWGRRDGITLTPQAAIVHRFIGRRVIPWADVHRITAEPWDGTPTAVLWGENWRTRLRAPSTGRFLQRDALFDEKVDVIVRWWLAHGGEEHSAPEPGRPTEWVALQPSPPPVLVSPARTWPVLVAAGAGMVLDATVIALAARWSRETGRSFTFVGERVPTVEELVLTLLVGVGLGLGASFWARRCVVPAGAGVRWRAVSSGAGIRAAAAGALALAAVVAPLVWFRAFPTVVSVGIVAVTLATGVACLASAGWVRRLESDRRLGLSTRGLFWLPPPMGGAPAVAPE